MQLIGCVFRLTHCLAFPSIFETNEYKRDFSKLMKTNEYFSVGNGGSVLPVR
jgi:hypothetical protein